MPARPRSIAGVIFARRRGLQIDAAIERSIHRVSRAAHPSSLARSAFRRQTPKVGAGCPNWARPDPCGGCPVMGIPTAIYIVWMVSRTTQALVEARKAAGLTQARLAEVIGI